MSKQYSQDFKKKAVNYLKILNDQGFVMVKKTKFENVRDLIQELDVSSYSLYKWHNDMQNLKKSLSPEELKKANDFFEVSEVMEENKIVSKNGNKAMQKEKLDVIAEALEEEEYSFIEEKVSESKEIFGIRFYAWLAKSHGIKGYNNMKKKQLLCSLGLAFIKKSGLVDPEKHLKNLKLGGK